MRTCSKCGRGFTNVRSFCGHQAVCGVEKVACSVCGKSFGKYGIKSHVKKHEKDHACPTCGKRISGSNVFCSHSCARRVVKDTCVLPSCLCCGKEVAARGKKYCSPQCMQDYLWRGRKEKIEKSKSADSFGIRLAKRYLLEKFGYKCFICGLTEWRGAPAPVIIDHVDGDSSNMRLDNLRLVCGNCDMQLPTYKSKNRGKGRYSRRMRYQAGKSY